MLVKTFGSVVHGINATTVTVEVNISPGVNFFLVGLPDNAVKESQQRISAALKNNGYKIPGKNIIVNMAPADIRKEGSAYDLTIAIGILAASEQIKSDKIGEYDYNGIIKYTAGEFETGKEAVKLQNELRKKGFPDAFVVAFKNGKRVPPNK